jgi:hypothetical protein
VSVSQQSVAPFKNKNSVEEGSQLSGCYKSVISKIQIVSGPIPADSLYLFSHHIDTITAGVDMATRVVAGSRKEVAGESVVRGCIPRYC